MTVRICSFDYCDKHQRELHGYPCWACHQEWEATHPNVAAAIQAGRISPAQLKAARAADAALAEPK